MKKRVTELKINNVQGNSLAQGENVLYKLPWAGVPFSLDFVSCNPGWESIRMPVTEIN